MAETLEDVFIAQGVELAARYPCEGCSRQVPPFALVRSDDAFLCTACLTDAAREATALAEAADLSLARDKKWAEIKEARQRAEDGGVVTELGRMDSDANSQRKLNGAVTMAQISLAAGEPFWISWTMADNSPADHSAAQIIAAGLAMGLHVAACHATAQTLRGQIEAAETITAVDAIAWPPVPPLEYPGE